MVEGKSLWRLPEEKKNTNIHSEILRTLKINFIIPMFLQVLCNYYKHSLNYLSSSLGFSSIRLFSDGIPPLASVTRPAT